MTFVGRAAFVTRPLDIFRINARSSGEERGLLGAGCKAHARAPAHHRSHLAPSAAPSAARTIIDNPYHAATKSGESSGQCNA